MSRRKRIKELSQEDLKAIRAVSKTLLGVAGILEYELKDIEQELAMSLYLNSNKFSKKDGSWNAFRSVVIKTSSLKIIRTRVQPSSKYFYTPHLSLDEPFNNSNNVTDETQNYIDAVNQHGELADGTEKAEILGLSLKIDMDLLILSLPQELQEVCGLLKYNTKYETAKLLKISRPTLDRRILEIKKVLIEQGFDIYF